MSHSPMSASRSTPVASCEAFTRSQKEDSALSAPPGNLTSPAALKSSQANTIQAAVSTPTKIISLNAAQPTESLRTKFSGLSMRPLYSSPATPISSVATLTESSPSPPSLSSITSSLSAAQPVSFSPLSNKRAAFLNKHMRSKSSHFPGMMSPPPSPLSAITPNSPTTSRMPLLRSTSLPTVPQYERAREKFVPTLGTPLSPSPTNISTNTNSWRNGMPIPTPSEGTRNYRMRERSPSRRPTSSSGYYSTSPKASFYSPLHHQSPRELRWGEDSYASSIASSSPSLCSSGPSTPSSIRSRSPSISSLETIPDSPDAEAEALEAERLAEEARKLAIAEEEEEEPEPVVMTRSASSPVSERSLRRRSQGGLEGFGGFIMPPLRAGSTGLTAEEKRRKRWSVCGGEKRADLELETIWEDRVVAVQSPPQRSLVGIVGSAEYEEYERGNGFGEEMI